MYFQKYKDVMADNNFLLLDLQSSFPNKTQNPTTNKQKNLQIKTKTNKKITTQKNQDKMNSSKQTFYRQKNLKCFVNQD